MKSKSGVYIYIGRKLNENSVKTEVSLDAIMNGKAQHWFCFSDNGCSSVFYVNNVQLLTLLHCIQQYIA